MRRPRIRFSVGWLMLAVAIAAVATLYASRSLRYQRLARLQHTKVAFFEVGAIEADACCRVADHRGPHSCLDGDFCEECAEERRNYARNHTALAIQYERAALYPWLVVKPASPKPE